MKDPSNLHLKVQELCDCFATTDPLKEMSEIEKGQTNDEVALKWLALAILHGINSNAERIGLQQDKDGGVTVIAKYRKAHLPSPGKEVAEQILDTVKEITHIDKAKGSTPLAFGFRNNSFELQVSTKEKKGERRVTIEFP